MNPPFLRAAAVAAAAALLVSGCASQRAETAADSVAAKAAADAALGRDALAMFRASFREQGIAKLDRIEQEMAVAACSQAGDPPKDVAARIEADAQATIRWPADGRWLGDWREGEKLAQNGRGMTWTDASAATSANGGNCYNCHEIDRKEVSFGTIGPSLWNYGKLRGVKDPADAASEPMVRYTWGKLWNSKASNACSNMPRFGHKQLLDARQIADLMALLLDPRSPVNQ